MQTAAWWAILSLVTIATITDLRSRRIPNWLSLPFLIAGVIASTVMGGWRGLADSLSGVTLAALLVGVLCCLRAMGFGDLKLLAAIGAWVGPQQLVMALIATGIVGGLLAIVYALWRGIAGESLDGAADLVFGIRRRGLRPHPTLVLDNASKLKMPYAPAIALGAVFSFFASGA